MLRVTLCESFAAKASSSLLAWKPSWVLGERKDLSTFLKRMNSDDDVQKLMSKNKLEQKKL